MLGKWLGKKTADKTAEKTADDFSAQEREHLRQFRLPGYQGALPENWFSRDQQQATLKLPFAAGQQVLKDLQDDAEVGHYQWRLDCQIAKLRNSQPELPLVYGNVIAVSSGKGGVGKSSIAAQLAVALAQTGASVGLLDADIYGPSMPTMMGGADEKQQIDAQNKMQPHVRHGVHVSSLGYLADSKDAAIWRGPMASAALQQLFRDTAWPRLDYMVVDLPPGTGDIQLTIAQKLPVTGAVVVTTPQNVATADAEKGIAMFRKLGIPITGLVENMSYYHCPSCGHEEAIFGHEGGRKTAAAHDVPLLAQLPLASPIREALDHGEPLLVGSPDHELNAAVREMATAVAAQLYQQAQKSV
ncbi:iron-sulfur cluster carrier protein ApbC [Pseudidiomarina terrestris]|uniref:Iron-sulfur cluster carrier protein n=1 Tax=Pseudidiomarina terrestris TaxID=2820060 RepID=A0AAW7QZE0_9GAMM|nr:MULTISPECIES: iron-sulfur cluster carrier protein ApbC [unclassified Pseudidiomarina]MDN7124245.1 iron-sulfur cluster carrier protein ApbC [Pseudidiomarina sp. 1APP75-32.1]MDN7127312.1 iron-sulfur cluster carrier protein ApbC [Pseudidiomarina sp. 1APR75-33.1]MDN7128502.1 iron-sulfur cluster carrier protein ApbC [Pseudidiomarina sp. 1APR75-15]MDN7135250.1 iron-sulfur cluster carrier protein ApbC [Pseudidiomarina sp. 1ASP75-5]MDN7138691.1 iron-sulfur cluster carrier protein ApbC [Pseudidiomar